MKDYKEEFDKFLKMLREGENFGFSRFSDGEVFILKGERIVLAKSHYVTGNVSGSGQYGEEDFKDYDPDRDSRIQSKLIEALKYKQFNYYKGLTGVVDEDIAGQGSFKLQLDLAGGDDDSLSFSNVFINNNYPRFINEFYTEMVNSKKPVVMVVNEKANLDSLQLNIVKDFRVGRNCIINDHGVIEDIKDWIKENSVEDHIFLCSASTLSNFIIHDCFKQFPNNTFIDIGTTLNPWIGLDGWSKNRMYLRHWLLGDLNKYGTQKDVWVSYE
tara:strand:+ start:488 stop:1300 length:813 start_codon:yes stop_codon:yes gene_type:complete